MTDSLPPLLPCPFCESSRLMTTSNGHDSMFVECEDCGSSGPTEEYEDEATAAWNRRAAIAQARSCVPAGMVLASVELLKRAESSLGSFCSDHGWGDADMQTMDDISGLLAAPPQPQPVQPSEPDRKPLSDDQRYDLIVENLGPSALTGGKMTPWDIFMLGISACETAHGIAAPQPKD